jgi:hypothetical protein
VTGGNIEKNKTDEFQQIFDFWIQGVILAKFENP